VLLNQVAAAQPDLQVEGSAIVASLSPACLILWRAHKEE